MGAFVSSFFVNEYFIMSVCVRHFRFYNSETNIRLGAGSLFEMRRAEGWGTGGTSDDGGEERQTRKLNFMRENK